MEYWYIISAYYIDLRECLYKFQDLINKGSFFFTECVDLLVTFHGFVYLYTLKLYSVRIQMSHNGSIKCF